MSFVTSMQSEPWLPSLVYIVPVPMAFVGHCHQVWRDQPSVFCSLVPSTVASGPEATPGIFVYHTAFVWRTHAYLGHSATRPWPSTHKTLSTKGARLCDIPWLQDTKALPKMAGLAALVWKALSFRSDSTHELWHSLVLRCAVTAV